MTRETCQVVRKGTRCGSMAFNLYKEKIDQGFLCDTCYWRDLSLSLIYQLQELRDSAVEHLSDFQEEKSLQKLRYEAEGES